MKTKTKTVGKTTDTGKDQRVVLNLSIAQAEGLFDWMSGFQCEEEPIKKIVKRIEKTLNKQSIIRNLAKTGPVTKELVKKAMEVAK